MSKRKLSLLLVTLLVIAGAVWAMRYLSSHSFSAREKPTGVEAFLARNVRRLATSSEARRLKNPLEPTPLAIAEARDHFADHCALCHANDGSGKTMLGENMYPPAPDMRQRDTQKLSDGELFVIVRNGIRFTGMPGWGGEDEENWKLVLFIRHLLQLSAKERELMNEINHLDGEAQNSGHSQAADKDKN